MPFFETADHTRLFYNDWGTGSPVIFIHGWAVGCESWEYQMTPLMREGLRCIAYDQRGCGRSDDPGHGSDYDTMADDLAALIERLDLREVTLVGHSMGGGVIARYLTRHGAERIARAALIATTTPFLLKSADNPDGIDTCVFDDIIARLSIDRPRYLSEIAPGFFGIGQPECSASPEMVQWGIRLALQASPRATIDLVHTNAEGDLRSDMRSFTMPTLIIHGGADSGNPIELTGWKTAQAIPGSRLIVYEGAPHGVFITHYKRLNADLLAFIKG